MPAVIISEAQPCIQMITARRSSRLDCLAISSIAPRFSCFALPHAGASHTATCKPGLLGVQSYYDGSGCITQAVHSVNTHGCLLRSVQCPMRSRLHPSGMFMLMFRPAIPVHIICVCVCVCVCLCVYFSDVPSFESIPVSTWWIAL